MSLKKYDTEKVIFNEGKATMSYFDSDRGFLLFFKQELDELSKNKISPKILDIGCGAGAKTKALKKIFLAFHFEGCDISKQAVKKAKIKPQGVKFFTADAQRLPLKSGQYDVVIMNSVLDHTKRPHLCLKECHRVLKKGGLFLFTDPIEADLTTIHGQLYRFEFFREMRKDYCGHYHAFNKKYLEKLFKKAGFKIEKQVFDWFFFAQVVDVFYYPILGLFGKGPEFNIRSYVFKNNSFSAKVLRIIRDVVTFILNTESRLTRAIPLGFFTYVKARKP